jgi:hypothetical protein
MSDHERVGSVGEEAAKLLAALQDWARESGSEHVHATAEGLSGLAGSINEHVATGSESCRYCPLCQVISAVRNTRPEVKDHLVVAASSLAQALSAALTPGPNKTDESRRSDPLEKIDLAADDWDGE